MFSEPDALEKLATLKNIELKMFRTDSETAGFHTKGYIFRKEEIYKIIIGSSNMTLRAITKTESGTRRLYRQKTENWHRRFYRSFQELWEDHHALAYDAFIENYRQEYLREQMIKSKDGRQCRSQS